MFIPDPDFSPYRIPDQTTKDVTDKIEYLFTLSWPELFTNLKLFIHPARTEEF
jgi:hypothetical protein